ncbi:MAG: VWA domain-containing protein [Planctomycetes bacterium]|nr:VWA domain-containing protein [Planctomycetota bacterium]
MTPTILTSHGVVLLLVLVAAGLSAFYAWLYRQEAATARALTRRQQRVLRTLRIAVAVLALLALARPALTMVRRERRLPVVPILVDESGSMVFPDCRDNPLVQASPKTQRRRYDTAQTIAQKLQEQLARTHRVRLLTFSDVLKLVRELAPEAASVPPADYGAAPTGESTNIGDAIQDALRDMAGDKLSGIVVLSDGRQTGGRRLDDAGAQATDARVPVHTVAFGSEFPLRDLRIDEVVAEPEVSLGDVLSFRLKITNQISAPLATKLTLLEEGQKVNEKALVLPRGESQVTIATIAEAEGTREFRLVLPQYDDEVNTENNEATVHVKVVKRTLRVLLIAGNPSREYFYLVPALLRDPVVELATYLQCADIDYTQQGNVSIERLPRSIEDWKKYDVVVLFDPDPNKITTQQVAEMENMVRTGGGLMVIAGRNHGLAKLIQVHAVKIRELLPVEIDKNDLPDYFQVFSQPFASERTPKGRGHPLMRLERDDRANEAVWATFPKLYWHHPVKQVKPRSISLLERSGSSPAERACLMAIHRYFEGAVFYSGLDSLWLWRYPYESYDYDRFWTDVIRYLGETRLRGTQSQVALNTDRASYAPGEEAQLRLRILDPALMAQLEGQQLYASVTSPAKEVQMVPLRPDPAGEMLYLGAYRARRVGSMLVAAKQAAPGASSEAKPLFDVKHTFQVRMQSLEARETSADLAAMKALAGQTKGVYIDYRNMGELDRLVKAIPTDPQVLSEEILVEVWDGSIFLILFLALIGGEWSLRKLWGLL